MFLSSRLQEKPQGLRQIQTFCLLRFFDKHFEGFFPFSDISIAGFHQGVNSKTNKTNNKNQSKFKKKVLFPLFHLFLKNQIPAAISA